MKKITRKIFAVLVTATVITGSISGCSRNGEPDESASTNGTQTDYQPVVINNCGIETTFQNPPTEVVSMGVTGLAYLVAAGGEEAIIGRANEWGEDPASWMGNRADNIALLSNEDISLEALVGLEPDLAYGGGFSSSTLSPETVTAMGIPAIVDAPECHYFYPNSPIDESFDTILNEITQLGKILGTSEAADQNVAELKAKLDQIAQEKPGQGRTVSYAYYYGEDKDLFSYGEQGVMGEINRTLDIKSAIDPNYHPHTGPIAAEAFIKSDPDMIIVLLGMGGATKESTMERLQQIPGFNEMKAVKNNEIFFAESAIAYASPTAIYGTIELAEQIRR